ncbi:hypothetical protein CYMTET_34990, partial [Cymbomonas tetramitiformis]
MSFTVYKTLHVSTGVEHCVTAYLTHPERTPVQEPACLPNLVVVKEGLLEVYALKHGHSTGPIEQSTKFELVAEYPLQGVVESICVLRPRETSGRAVELRDSLVLAFAEARIAVVEFNLVSWQLTTSSLHAYEGASYGAGVVNPPSRPVLAPYVISEPLGRCVAALLPAGGIAFLEAASHSEEDDIATPRKLADDLYTPKLTSQAQHSGGAAAVAKSYVVDLHVLRVKRVRDIAFLNGYAEPSLIMLWEDDATWSARLAVRKDTCRLSVMSVNLADKRHPLVWSAKGLPSDAFRVYPAPSPIGGAVVFCANLILYHTQGHSCALAVNPMARGGELAPGVVGEEATKMASIYSPAPAAAEGAPRAEAAAALDGARGVWVERDTMLISTKTGVLLVLNLLYDGRMVSGMRLVRCGAAVLTSGLCAVNSNLVFLGSRLGDSLLVGLKEKLMAPPAAALSIDAPPAKKRRVEDGGEGDLEEDEDDAADELLMYGDAEEDGSGVGVTEQAIVVAASQGALGSGRRTFELSIQDSFAGAATLAMPRAPGQLALAMPRAPGPLALAMPRAPGPLALAMPRAPGPLALAMPRAPGPLALAMPHAPGPLA